MSKLDEIIEYLDKNYTKEKVENINGSLGMHYDGLIYDYYFEDSVYSADYLNTNEYFESNCQNLNYDEKKFFKEMLVENDEKNKLKVIELIVNLLNKSSYEDNGVGKNDITKILNVLSRIGVYSKLDSSSNEYQFLSEKIVDSGSYSDIIEVSSTVYKKRLKSPYINEDKWKIRMRREFDNMKKLSFSDYILKVYSFDEEDYSYLMEKCDCDLVDYLVKNPNMQEEDCFSIFYDILNGMGDAHSQSIIHRDLHLGNIMRKDGHFVIGDFGLSKDTMLSSSFKSSDTPKNSNMFMDPVGKSDFTLLDKQSDIYSIGKIFEYILIDKPYSDKISFIIEKCINRDRKKRYKNIYEIISDFEEVKNGDKKVSSEKELIQNLQNSIYNVEIHDYIMNLIRDTNLCNVIVYHRLFSFADLILQFDDAEQEKIWKEIRNYYSDSTGNGGWSNYDIYASISFAYICQSINLKTRKIAKDVLEGCSHARYRAADDFNKIKLTCPELF